MPQTILKKIFEASTVSASPTAINIRPDIAGVADCRGNTSAKTLIVRVTGGSGSPTFNVQGAGSIDPGATTTWTAVAARPAGGGAYVATALTLATGNQDEWMLDPNDQPEFLRLNIAANAGAALVEAWISLEV